MKAYTEFTGQEMSDAGSDAYLSSQGSGIADRIPDDQTIAAQQLDDLRNTTAGSDAHINSKDRVLGTIRRSGVDPVRYRNRVGDVDVESTMEKIANGDAPSVKARQAAERLDTASAKLFEGITADAWVDDDGKIDF